MGVQLSCARKQGAVEVEIEARVEASVDEEREDSATVVGAHRSARAAVLFLCKTIQNSSLVL